MIPYFLKKKFYTFANPFMVINGWLYYIFQAPRNGLIKVHLCPGQNNYLDGWINIDANIFTGKCDVWLDLRNFLPFRDSTIDVMYSHHVVEHLPNIKNHFSDVFRCLKPGGKYRVGGPNGDSAITKFMEQDRDWFDDFPEQRKSIGGKLENFIFCQGEHLTILTFSYLEEIMSEVGFTNIKSCIPTKETSEPELFLECLSMEYESDFNTPHTLIVEAEKPK